MAQDHFGDPAAEVIALHGITEFGEWTSTSSTGSANMYNSDNVYTRVPWGDVTPTGGQITPSLSRVEQRTAMSPALRDSFLDQAQAQLQVAMSDGHLTNIRRMLGLPTSLHTGNLKASPTPTAEELRVQGRSMGTIQHRLYIKCMGPLGTRYVYIPKAQVADIGPLVFSRQGHYEPGATFDLLEDTQYDNYWFRDETS